MTSFSGFSSFADELREFADEAEEAQEEVPTAVDIAVRRLTRRMAGTAARVAPKDTGQLARSIEAYRRDLMSWGFGTDLEYGPPVEYGSDPHIIRPDDAEALAFPGEDGETVFAAKVEHPGTPPQPFVRKAFREHESELEREINTELDRVFEAAFS